MKKLLAIVALIAPLSQAGVVKVATFPVRHPVQTTKGLGKAAAHVAKAIYNF